MSELVEEFRDVARFDVDDGGMSQTYRGRYVEYIHFAVLLAHIERLESAVRAVKDWDIENFKLRGAFVVPQQIRQMIQAATRGEGE